MEEQRDKGLQILTIPQMAKRKGISESILYKEIQAGNLHAKLRRGCSRGYMITEEIFNDWWNNGTVDACTGR